SCLEELDQGCPAKRVRRGERPDRVQPRDRVRRVAGRIARSPGSHQGMAERRRTEQSRAPSCGTAADVEAVATGGYCDTHRESVGARRPGTRRRLYDIPGGRQPLLLSDGCPRKRRSRLSRDVPARRGINQVDGSALTKSAHHSFHWRTSMRTMSRVFVLVCLVGSLASAAAAGG